MHRFFDYLLFRYYFCLSLFFLLTIISITKCIALESTNSVYETSDQSSLKAPIKLEARIDIPQAINLEKALSIAINNNLDVTESKYLRNLSKWIYWENISYFLPDYKLGLSTQRLDGSFLIGGILPIMTLTSSANAFMRFDYNFFEGGKGFFNTIASYKLFRSQEQDLKSVINNILLEVTKAYNSLLNAEATMDVLETTYKEALEELELNKRLFNEGVGTRLDVLNSEAVLIQHKQDIIEQKTKIREKSINLARLLNLDLGIHLKSDLMDLKLAEAFNFEQPINELINIAVSNRSEIKSAILEHTAYKSYIFSSYSPFLPKVNFYGQYGGTGNVFFHRTKIKEVVPDAIALSENGNPVVQKVTRDRFVEQTFDPQIDLTNITNVSSVVRGAGKPFYTSVDDSLMTSKFIGIQFDWDIANGLGLTTVSRINQARNNAKVKEANIKKIKQKVEQEVRIAYLNLQTSKELIEVAERQIDASKEALHLAKIRLENGVGINTELIAAEKQYKNSLLSQVNVIINFNNSYAEYLHSLGIISIDSLTKKLDL